MLRISESRYQKVVIVAETMDALSMTHFCIKDKEGDVGWHLDYGLTDGTYKDFVQWEETIFSNRD